MKEKLFNEKTKVVIKDILVVGTVIAVSAMAGHLLFKLKYGEI